MKQRGQTALRIYNAVITQADVPSYIDVAWINRGFTTITV